MDPAADSGWLTVAEFAAKLRTTPAEIYAAVKRGEIPGAIRIGERRGIRIPVAAYPAYVEAHLVTQQAA
jgi:excisionase family DNA binding protein